MLLKFINYSVFSSSILLFLTINNLRLSVSNCFKTVSKTRNWELKTVEIEYKFSHQTRADSIGGASCRIRDRETLHL